MRSTKLISLLVLFVVLVPRWSAAQSNAAKCDPAAVIKKANALKSTGDATKDIALLQDLAADIKAQKGACNGRSTPDPATHAAFKIPEASITVFFPKSYTLTKNQEPNRRGSFVSYDFSVTSGPTPSPYFAEIQFFSEKSIADFIKKCGTNGFCFDGDYPTVERYNGQKKAFAESKDYQGYKLRKFGDRNYFVSSTPFPSGAVIISEYTTFVGDLKVDILILCDMNQPKCSQPETADSLFSSLTIQH